MTKEQLKSLPTLSIKELKALYKDLYKVEPTGYRKTRAHIIRSITRHYEGISRAVSLKP